MKFRWTTRNSCMIRDKFDYHTARYMIYTSLHIHMTTKVSQNLMLICVV